MTIDEAIERCETLATNGHIIFSRDPDIAEECNEKYKQLAEWLEELKCYKNDNDFSDYADRLHKIAFNSGYNNAIDDFVQKVKEHQYVLSDVINSKDYGMFTVGIEQIAEQLKAGGK